MNQRKLHKKKERKKKVRQKVLARRSRMRYEAKEHRQVEQESRKARSRKRPIRAEEYRLAQKLRDLEIRIQLEQNAEILKGLEQEYQAELRAQQESYMSGASDTDESNVSKEPAQSSLVEKATEHLNKKVESIFEEGHIGFGPESTSRKKIRK